MNDSSGKISGLKIILTIRWHRRLPRLQLQPLQQLFQYQCHCSSSPLLQHNNKRYYILTLLSTHTQLYVNFKTLKMFSASKSFRKNFLYCRFTSSLVCNLIHSWRHLLTLTAYEYLVTIVLFLKAKFTFFYFIFQHQFLKVCTARWWFYQEFC